MASWQDDPAERRRLEIEYGRKISLINEFQEVNKFVTECKVYKPNDNSETWEVVVNVNVVGAEAIVDKFWEFPSDQLKATLMLLGVTTI